MHPEQQGRGAITVFWGHQQDWHAIDVIEPSLSLQGDGQ
jgi:hypothetical protein